MVKILLLSEVPHFISSYVCGKQTEVTGPNMVKLNGDPNHQRGYCNSVKLIYKTTVSTFYQKEEPGLWIRSSIGTRVGSKNGQESQDEKGVNRELDEDTGSGRLVELEKDPETTFYGRRVKRSS